MIDDRKLLISVTALALVGVLGLFIYSSTLEPLSLEIGEIGEEHVGKIIRTQGTLTKVRMAAGGSLSMTICDFNTSSSISVFYSPDSGSAPAGLLPGALIRIEGEVEIYEGSVEISVAKASQITLLMPANSTEYSLHVLMESLQMFDGLNVSTTGQIADIEPIYSADGLIGTGFSIVGEFENKTYCLECFCYDRDISVSFSDWDAVIVTGRISYYTANGSWQMTAEIVAAA